MKRTARVGMLVGAVAMGAVLGLNSATPALAQSGTAASAASPVSQFFEPGAKVPGDLFKPGAQLTIKRNADYARSVKLDPASSQAAPIDMGEACHTEVISKTSGSGPTTLVLSVNKERSVVLNGQGGISLGAISASVGFSVTKAYRVTNETRYEVPKGKFGTVEAYTLMHHYRARVTMRPYLGVVDVYKPVGVCFNQWAE
ncbi:hypothetical protein [Streptomyces sp. NPDC007205]|uniref:hypothetical protein n=1 Tax=Streptomyces sp. NPDC007205 TaxID=3154316 RepID=UPI0033DCD603